MSEYIMECNKGTDVTLFKERIVRCRDCKHSPQKNTLGGKKNVGYLCKRFDEPDGGFALVQPDGFCAWGERRDA